MIDHQYPPADPLGGHMQAMLKLGEGSGYGILGIYGLDGDQAAMGADFQKLVEGDGVVTA